MDESVQFLQISKICFQKRNYNRLILKLFQPVTQPCIRNSGLITHFALCYLLRPDDGGAGAVHQTVGGGQHDQTSHPEAVLTTQQG